MRFLRKVSYLAFVSLLVSFSSLAQEVPTEATPQDVENMSDSQLENAVEKAQQQGFTQQQIESMARARGFSEAEISNLRQRVQNLQTQTGSTTLDQAQLREQLGDYDLGLEELVDENQFLTEDLTGRVFGSELFNNPKLSFVPSLNIPTPQDYQLGSGDEIIIDIWGASEKTYQLLIGPEGSVKIPDLGPVYLSGLKMEDASSKLISRLSQIYAGLGNNTYAQVSLGRIKSIKVNIVGEIKVPGTYTLSSFSTILHALYQAGGPSVNGSYRNIEVYRKSKKVASFDVYDYILQGDFSKNIVLEDQDVIRIPVYETRVKIAGEVKRPAVYELEAGESLTRLINYSGGLTDEAYARLVTIRRRTDNARKIVTIKSERFDEFALLSGDEVTVSRILDAFENRVTIKGAVWRPGEYELTDSLTLSELITKAEGVTADVFMGRGQILRTNKDLSYINLSFETRKVIAGEEDYLLKAEDVVTIESIYNLTNRGFVNISGEVRNPGEFLLKDSLTVEDLIFQAGGFTAAASSSYVEVSRRINPDSVKDESLSAIVLKFPINEQLDLSQEDSKFQLKSFDNVIVRSDPYFERQQHVRISGEVYYPGLYTLEKKDERVSDLIRKAGGVSAFGYPEGGRLLRNTNGEQTQININIEAILKYPNIVDNISLQPGDELFIPKKLQTVSVQGEVFDGGNYVYSTASFKDYISLSGGFNRNADKSKSYIVYTNGGSDKTRRFLWFKSYPKVEPGARLVVPLKPEQNNNKLSVQEILAISSSLLTMALLIDRLGS